MYYDPSLRLGNDLVFASSGAPSIPQCCFTESFVGNLGSGFRIALQLERDCGGSVYLIHLRSLSCTDTG